MVLVNPLLLVFYNNPKQKLNYRDCENLEQEVFFIYLFFLLFSPQDVFNVTELFRSVVSTALLGAWFHSAQQHLSHFVDCSPLPCYSVRTSVSERVTLQMPLRYVRRYVNTSLLKCSTACYWSSECRTVQNFTLACSSESERITLQMHYSVSTSK